jgi:hypothetical protein
MPKSPFQYNPTLTAVALAYSNPAYALIADQVLPVVPVATENFEYLAYPKEDAFTVPDTRVGRTSKTNQTEFGSSLVTGSTEDYGLEDPIPNKDITNAQNSGLPYDPLARSTEYLTNLVRLDREVRVAGKVFTAANYATGSKATLSGTSQWSDPASDPAAAMLAALDSMTMRGNTLVLGQASWTALRQNVNMVKKVLGSASTSGMLTRQQVADALELNAVLVGSSWVNTARKGQAANLARTWGKHAALLFIDPSADNTRGMTFGITAEFGSMMAGTIMDDPDIGLRGGVRVRVGRSVKELIMGSDLGYFFENAVA